MVVAADRDQAVAEVTYLRDAGVRERVTQRMRVTELGMLSKLYM